MAPRLPLQMRSELASGCSTQPSCTSVHCFYTEIELFTPGAGSAACLIIRLRVGVQRGSSLFDLDVAPMIHFRYHREIFSPPVEPVQRKGLMDKQPECKITLVFPFPLLYKKTLSTEVVSFSLIFVKVP